MWLTRCSRGPWWPCCFFPHAFKSGLLRLDARETCLCLILYPGISMGCMGNHTLILSSVPQHSRLPFREGAWVPALSLFTNAQPCKASPLPLSQYDCGLLCCACSGNICPLEYRDHLFSPCGSSRSPNHSILPLSPHCSELQRCTSDRANWGWFPELACRLRM